MEATNKDTFLDDVLTSFTGKNRRQVVRDGLCMCCDSTGNIATSFSDDISRKEYAISGLCQSCQDDVFGSSDEPEDPWDNQWADDDALGSAGMGTDEYYF